MSHRPWIAITALAALTLGVTLSAHADGKATYDLYCASCHGVEGSGDGPVAGALTPKPTNFQDPSYWERLGPGGDIRILKSIKKGGGATDHSTNMPAWEPVLTDDQVRDIITYLRRLAGPATSGESATLPPAEPPAASPARPPSRRPADPAQTR